MKKQPTLRLHKRKDKKARTVEASVVHEASSSTTNIKGRSAEKCCSSSDGGTHSARVTVASSKHSIDTLKELTVTSPGVIDKVISSNLVMQNEQRSNRVARLGSAANLARPGAMAGRICDAAAQLNCANAAKLNFAPPSHLSQLEAGKKIYSWSTKFKESRRDVPTRLRYLKLLTFYALPDELGYLYENNQRAIFHVFHESFVALINDNKKLRTKMYYDELYYLLIVLYELITICSGAVFAGWQFDSIYHVIHHMLISETNRTIRYMVFAIFIAWSYALNVNMPVSTFKHILFLCFNFKAYRFVTGVDFEYMLHSFSLYLDLVVSSIDDMSLKSVDDKRTMFRVVFDLHLKHLFSVIFNNSYLTNTGYIGEHTFNSVETLDLFKLKLFYNSDEANDTFFNVKNRTLQLTLAHALCNWIVNCLFVHAKIFVDNKGNNEEVIFFSTQDNLNNFFLDPILEDNNRDVKKTSNTAAVASTDSATNVNINTNTNTAKTLTHTASVSKVKVVNQLKSALQQQASVTASNFNNNNNNNNSLNSTRKSATFEGEYNFEEFYNKQYTSLRHMITMEEKIKKSKSHIVSNIFYQNIFSIADDNTNLRLFFDACRIVFVHFSQDINLIRKTLYVLYFYISPRDLSSLTNLYKDKELFSTIMEYDNALYPSFCCPSCFDRKNFASTKNSIVACQKKYKNNLSVESIQKIIISILEAYFYGEVLNDSNCKRIFRFVRIFVSQNEQNISRSIWEYIIVVLNRLCAYLITEKKAVVESNIKEEDSFFRFFVTTLFTVHLRANMNGFTSRQVHWQGLYEITSMCFFDSVFVNIWGKACDTVTWMLCLLIYQIDLNDLPLKKLIINRRQLLKQQKQNISSTNKSDEAQKISHNRMLSGTLVSLTNNLKKSINEQKPLFKEEVVIICEEEEEKNAGVVTPEKLKYQASGSSVSEHVDVEVYDAADKADKVEKNPKPLNNVEKISDNHDFLYKIDDFYDENNEKFIDEFKLIKTNSLNKLDDKTDKNSSTELLTNDKLDDEVIHSTYNLSMPNVQLSKINCTVAFLWNTMVGLMKPTLFEGCCSNTNETNKCSNNLRIVDVWFGIYRNLLACYENQGISLDNKSTPPMPKLIPPLNHFFELVINLVNDILDANSENLLSSKYFEECCKFVNCMVMQEHAHVALDDSQLSEYYYTADRILNLHDNIAIVQVWLTHSYRIYHLKNLNGSMFLFEKICNALKKIFDSDDKTLVNVNICILLCSCVGYEIYLEKSEQLFDVLLANSLSVRACTSRIVLLNCMASVFLCDNFEQMLRILAATLIQLRQENVKVAICAVDNLRCMFGFCKSEAGREKKFSKAFYYVVLYCCDFLNAKRIYFFDLFKDKNYKELDSFLLCSKLVLLVYEISCSVDFSGNLELLNGDKKKLLNMVINLFQAFTTNEFDDTLLKDFFNVYRNVQTFLYYGEELFIRPCDETCDDGQNQNQPQNLCNNSNLSLNRLNQTAFISEEAPSFDHVNKTKRLTTLISTTSYALCMLLLYQNQFPLPFSPKRMSSLVNEQYEMVDNNHKMCMYGVNNNYIITVIERENEKNMLLVVRSSAGKFAWQFSLLKQYDMESEQALFGCVKKSGETGEHLCSFGEISEEIINNDMVKNFRQTHKNQHILLSDPEKVTSITEKITNFNSRYNRPMLVKKFVQVMSKVDPHLTQKLKNTSSFELSQSIEHLNSESIDPFQNEANKSMLFTLNVAQTSARYLLLQLNFIDESVRNSFKLIQDNGRLWRDLAELDKRPERETYKVAIFYVGANQEDKISICNNTCGSEAYHEFLTNLGEYVDLADHPGFLGGLARNYSTGKHSLYWCDAMVEIMFHVSTLLPVSAEYGIVTKMKHLGNDEVHIIWNEHSRPFRRGIINTEFGDLIIVLTPLYKQHGAVWKRGVRLVRVDMLKKPMITTTSPLHDGCVVQFEQLGFLLRETVRNVCHMLRFCTPSYKHNFENRRDFIGYFINEHCDKSGSHERYLNSMF